MNQIRKLTQQSTVTVDNLNPLESQIESIVHLFEHPLSPVVIQVVTPVLTKIDFFLKSCPANTEIHAFVEQSLRLMTHEKVPRGQAVFHKGEKGQKVYIILKGQAGVYVPREEADILEDENIHLSPRIQTLAKTGKTGSKKHLLRSIHQKKLSSYVDILCQLKKHYPYRYFTQNGTMTYHQISVLRAGAQFGEVALVNDEPRAASIIALDQLVLLSLTKDDFYKIFQEQVLQDNAKHQRISDAFRNLGLNSMPAALTSQFRMVSYKSNELLWKEGEQPAQILVVIDGVVSYLKRLHTNTQQRICNHSAGAILGHNELIVDQKRWFTCKTASIVTAYALTSEQFKQALRQYPQLVAYLKCHSANFKRWYELRLQELTDLQSSTHALTTTTSQLEYRDYLEKEWTPIKTKKNFTTIRSGQHTHFSTEKMVTSNTEKFVKLQKSTEKQDLNLLAGCDKKYLKFLKPQPFVQSKPRHLFLSPTLKQGLLSHLRHQVNDHHRGLSFQGLISQMTATKQAPIRSVDQQTNSDLWRTNSQTIKYKSRSQDCLQIDRSSNDYGFRYSNQEI